MAKGACERSSATASDPSPSGNMVTAAQPGFFSSWRKAKRRSFIFTISDLRLTTRRNTKACDPNTKSQTPNTRKTPSLNLQADDDAVEYSKGSPQDRVS